MLFNYLLQLLGGGNTDNIKSLINEGALLVDVRTQNEFVENTVSGSINIPLNTIENQLKFLENRKSIIVFCKSGGRSAIAKALLERNGFHNVINAGTCKRVNKIMHN